MEILNIPIGQVHPSPMNPRKTFDEDALQELADNIASQGLLQPVTVRPIERSGVAGAYTMANLDIKYEIVCGERRYRAMTMLNKRDPKKWATIAVIVREKMTDDEAFDAMITENLQRKDVDPIEEAYAFGQLIEKGSTAEEVALRFGKSIRFVQDRVKLNNLIPELLLRVKEGTMAIAAGMIICKFDEELQRKFFDTYGNYSQIGKETAVTFTDRTFMNINRSSWYQTDNQEDEDFDGGCGRKCAECQLNTANANCLFWEMKAKADEGKCTHRPSFEAKHMAFLLSFLESEGDNIVKKGEALDYGKTVIIDTANCWNADVQRVHDEAVKILTERGYEIVKPGEVFGSPVYYSADDDRIPKMLKDGEIYRCIDFLSYGSLPTPKIAHYYIQSKAKDSNSQNGSIAPTEVVSLVGKYKRNIEIANEGIAKSHCELAKSIGPAKRRGELCKEEQIAFDMFILRTLDTDFFQHHYKICMSSGQRPTETQLRDIAANNTDDRDMWYREYIRGQFTQSSYPGAIGSNLANRVLPIWRAKEYGEISEKAIKALDKKNAKIEERLKELGYDVHGNKLKS